MRIEDDGELSFDDVLDRFSDVEEAAARLRGWGWQQGAFRTLGCASPPDGEVGWVEIVADLFADPVSAQQAVAYFADVRAESGRLTFGPSPGIGDHAVSLAGLASNGNEVTIYAYQPEENETRDGETAGPLFICVTGRSPTGAPLSDVAFVLQQLLADAGR